MSSCYTLISSSKSIVHVRGETEKRGCSGLPELRHNKISTKAVTSPIKKRHQSTLKHTNERGIRTVFES